MPDKSVYVSFTANGMSFTATEVNGEAIISLKSDADLSKAAGVVLYYLNHPIELARLLKSETQYKHIIFEAAGASIMVGFHNAHPKQIADQIISAPSIKIKHYAYNGGA